MFHLKYSNTWSNNEVNRDFGGVYLAIQSHIQSLQNLFDLFWHLFKEIGRGKERGSAGQANSRTSKLQVRRGLGWRDVR